MKIKSDSILFFDLDGTLIDTDFANFLSYQEAIQSVIGSKTKILYVPNERFNRTFLKRVVPKLAEEKLVEIIRQKEINYKKYVTHTKLIRPVSDILIRYSKTNKTVLVTKCREDRAILTLEHHKLIDKFNHLFFKQSTDNQLNKYKNALNNSGLSAQSVIIFENEKIEIDDAILAGIPINNIITS